MKEMKTMCNLPAKITAQIEAAEMDCDLTVSIHIETQEHVEDVAKILRSIKSRAKELDEARKEITKPIDEEKAAVMAQFKPILERLSTAEKAIKSAIIDYEKRCAEERERLQKIADEQAQREADAKRVAMIADAEMAVEQGKPELAEAYLNKAEAVKPMPVNVTKQLRPSGLSMGTRWTFEIVNDALIPREFLIVDEQRLQRYVNAMKESANVPGVKFVAVQSLSAKAY
jgi:hypothetical protein